jgi:CubicO group peptidase (beta-lactamase class C family)
LHRTTGRARQSPARLAIPQQVYDLASLTKALVTAPVCAALSAMGALDIHAPVRDVLPSVHQGITADMLLRHTSGYPAWLPLYAEVEPVRTPAARRSILDAAQAVPLASTPGERAVYSDIGFLVLLDLVETLAGHDIATLFRMLITQPAGIHGLTWGAPDAAATEACPIRGHVVEGEVHDLNAAAMGGVSSHAGLFGSARSVARLVEALTTPTPALAPVHAQLTAWWATSGPGTHRGGWDTPSRGTYSSTGSRFPDGTVGHLGYTGTSIWAVPEQQVQVVLLTNRVHPIDQLDDIRALRPILHDALATDLGWTEQIT